MMVIYCKANAMPPETSSAVFPVISYSISNSVPSVFKRAINLPLYPPLSSYKDKYIFP